MPSAIDHVVVVVEDLSQAVRDYERLGFTVNPGGDHAHRGSHNALVTFQDGSYIELIAFKYEPPVKDNDWWDFLQVGEGLVDFALVSGDLRADLEHLTAHGLDVTGPMEGGRVRTDGVRVAWRVARLNTGTERLPFLIEDITARELRVPQGEEAVHPNGITGMAEVTVAAASLTTAAPLYHGLLGAPEDATRFMVGNQSVQLVEPGGSGSGIAEFISSHGSGPFQVTLRGPAPRTGDVRDLDPELTHSARFIVE